MPEDYYNDEPGTSAPAEKSSDSTAKAESFLLPKAVLRGREFEAGDTISLKLVADHGEEIEVSPVGVETEPETEEPEPEEMPEAAPAGMGNMAGMME